MSLQTQRLPLEQLRTYFSDRTLLLLLESIEQGHTAALAWQISDQTQQVNILWEQANNTIYYHQLPDNPALLAACKQHLQQTICPLSLERHAPYFKLTSLSACPPSRIEELTQGYDGAWFDYQFYTYPSHIAPALQSSVPVYSITAELLANTQIQERDMLIDEIIGMWGSIENFVRYGFGSVAILDNTIVSFCTAEFLGHTRCGIGIATHPDYQNRGIATATATHMIQQALARKIIPHWECRAYNQASVRLAQKLGFQQLKQSAYWGGMFVAERSV